MARKKPAPVGPIPVESIKHKDSRTNIPTNELRDFVADDESAPKTMLYPRDPSLDPQLVWNGKDEQDHQDLSVPVVPIYIQEKIHPQALIDDFLARARTDRPDEQLDMFADFNGIDGFDRKTDFYSHKAESQPHWSNRMILGDSLLVMSSLAEKEGLKGKVQCIYIDPPYGIKFGSNWQVSTRKRDVKDGNTSDVTRQPEQIRAFRDTWNLGVHSYLNYLRDRLFVARGLLIDTGSIFVQIGDENVHLVRSLLDEVFGSENFVSLIAFSKTSSTTGKFLPNTSDYILWFGRDVNQLKYRTLYVDKEVGGSGASKYDQVELGDGSRRSLSSSERLDPSSLPKGSRVYRLGDLTSPRVREARTGYYPITMFGREFLPKQGEWKTHREGIERLKLAGRVQVTGNSLSYVRFIDDFPAYSLGNTWIDIGGIQSRADPKVYAVQTSTSVITRCLLMTTDPGDLILDPTCGAGTTAYVAEQWGRRWITIDTSRVALALARTRLMAAKFPYYLLADSEAGIKKEAEITGRTPPPHPTEKDIRKGFVWKRVPHVTLKSIANNPDIREGMTRAEIDKAIAKHADSEVLLDQPYEHNKRIRVSGPFTVESLSPHRVLPTDDDPPRTEAVASRERIGDFATTILDNLRKAGVQNTVKGERLTFTRLDPAPGPWVHASGEYVETDGTTKRVAVHLGPEFGTVGPKDVTEAAKQAVKGLGHDLLVVCGFSFDPHVDEGSKDFGRLKVLITRMNPDLAMGDDLLKKTGAGNLFMVFGEPDFSCDPDADGNLVVTLKGLDVYDPTTGHVRNNSTDDIACWFLDTNYNGESFFVRHAYFTGADEPYEKLKRALKADVDESAWSSLYRTTSRPFPRPATGKVAVKVINHYGDEVLKVFSV